MFGGVKLFNPFSQTIPMAFYIRYHSIRGDARLKKWKKDVATNIMKNLFFRMILKTYRQSKPSCHVLVLVIPEWLI